MQVVMDNSINSRLICPNLNRLQDNQYALQVIELAEKGVTFYVPSIWHYEVAQVVYSLIKNETIKFAEANLYFETLNTLPIITDTQSHLETTKRTLALSQAHNISIYDAAYLELSIRRNCSLASNDKALNNAANALGINLI